MKSVQGIWEVEHRNAKGELLWGEEKENSFTMQGINSLLTAYFRGDAGPTQFYIRFCNGALLPSSSLADVVGEPVVGTGYSSTLVPRSALGWPTLEIDNSQWRVVSLAVQITASGGMIGPISTMFLATSIDSSGLLISRLSLSTTRTLIDGDTMNARMRVKGISA